MNLESKWLEDFVALATTRSFSQAAQKRFVTQPAFSRRIRSLENMLGLTLVNRACTSIELTVLASGWLLGGTWMVCTVLIMESVSRWRSPALATAAAQRL